MEETIGWLLPLLIAVSLGNVCCSAPEQRPLRTSGLIVTGVLLAVMSLWLMLRPAIHWNGPTLFALDSFHQFAFNLRLTLVQMPLLWVVWWWMWEEPSDSADDSKPERGLRQTALTCLLLTLLSDDPWLWYGALVAFSFFQNSLVSRSASQDFRLTALRGGHWLGVLLLLISIGILSFDFRWHSFSELGSVRDEWDTLSETQQAAATLATTLASWSVLLMAAVFPISVLRIDRNDGSGMEILAVVIAGAVCLQFSPLFSGLDATAAHRSLLLLTVLTATVCSWDQPGVRRTARCLGVAFLMLSLMGLLIVGVNATSQLARALSLEHLALALLLWSLWARERHDRKSKVLTNGLAVLLLVGFSSSLLSLSTKVSSLGRQDTLNVLLAAGICFGLMKCVTRSFLQDSRAGSKQESPAPAEDAGPFCGSRLSIACLVGTVIVATTRVELWKKGLALLVIPSLEIWGGIIAGACSAVVWEHRRLKSADAFRPAGSFTRLLESQFHLITIWRGVAQLPGIALSTLLNLRDIRQSRIPARTSRRQSPVGHELPFVWELGLGLASLIVLSCLFVWMGE